MKPREQETRFRSLNEDMLASLQSRLVLITGSAVADR